MVLAYTEMIARKLHIVGGQFSCRTRVSSISIAPAGCCKQRPFKC